MAGPTTTFEPEVIQRSTPWQASAKQALEALREQRRVMRRWYEKFRTEFVPRFMAAYNAEAKKQGLPPMDTRWLKIVPRFAGGAAGPKTFYEKHRATLQPKMFPGRSAADQEKAFDLFLYELEKMPYVLSGPSSGILSHESGHVRSFYTDPKTVVESRRPRSRLTDKVGRKPLMETAVDEAVGSYRGFQTAWKAWGKWGIPRKAWGAWTGFPTYVSKMSADQVKDLLARLKKLEGKLPGISDMARKAIFSYGDYIRPVLYNVPGKDWTDQEKKALKAWLKSRGGSYREKVPSTRGRRLRHLKRQPYVEREQKETGMRLSERRWPPLSCRAGEVVPFPGAWQGREEPSKPPEGGKGSVVPFRKRWFLLHFGTDLLGFYDSRRKAEEAQRAVAHEFSSGEGAGRIDNKGILEDAVNEDIFFGVANILRSRGIISDIGIDENDELLHTDLRDPAHQVFADTTFDFYSEDAWAPVRHAMAAAGLGIVEMPSGFEPPRQAIMEHEPATLLDLSLDRLPPGMYQKLLPSDRRIQKAVKTASEAIAELVRRKLRYD